MISRLESRKTMFRQDPVPPNLSWGSPLDSLLGVMCRERPANGKSNYMLDLRHMARAWKPKGN